MMTDRDLSQALELLLLRTTQDLMSWKTRTDAEGGIELIGEGIAGHRVKISESARNYSLWIGREIPGKKSLKVVGAVTDKLPSDESVRSILEGKVFAIFREAYRRARTEDYEEFEAAAAQGVQTSSPSSARTTRDTTSGASLDEGMEPDNEMEF
jgi:hypothetical protein